MKPSPIQEQDGAWSMRRILALACMANAICISWNPTAPWEHIALFIGAALVLLGLTTIADLKVIGKTITAPGQDSI